MREICETDEERRAQMNTKPRVRDPGPR
jgi:hypothetical protein